MNANLIENENNIIFYEDEARNSKVEVVLKEDNVWLNANAIAILKCSKACNCKTY